jgi:vacuolar protein sorting-associated protein 16
MSLLYNIGDWFTLGHGNTYRKIELYQLEMGNVDLEQMRVFAAPFAGPIAITKILKPSSKGVSPKPVIHIYSPSGNQISTINVSENPIL